MGRSPTWFYVLPCRSIGDSYAKGLGVSADPEIDVRTLDPACKFFVIASDGVFEFLSSQQVVEIVKAYNDPDLAATEVVKLSYQAWRKNEVGEGFD